MLEHLVDWFVIGLAVATGLSIAVCIVIAIIAVIKELHSLRNP